MPDHPFPLPQKTTGRIILLATITAKPGKGDELQTALAAVRKLSESSDEKGTHTYRTTRQAEADTDVFVVFEEYDLPNGIPEHTAAQPFQALAGAGIIADLKIQYFSEFDGAGKFLHP
ncbi:hypothetical protein T439DRAFT_325680 [Meredithblackwellia eburnea MCA 4105]